MKNEIKDKWSEIITYLRDEYLINGVLFRTWIEPLEVISFQNDTLVIAINEQTQGDILDLIEKRYKIPFQVAIEVKTGKQVDIRFVYKSEIEEKGVSSYNKENILEEKYPFLKQGHSFDTFVVRDRKSVV